MRHRLPISERCKERSNVTKGILCSNRMSVLKPNVEHHEGRGVRSCPIFPELRPILDEAFEIFGDKSEYVVAAPQYRAAANTAMVWKNANLRSEMTRLLRCAGVSGWPRLFHSMRASRQTELQREFPLHVVCSSLGNSRRMPSRVTCWLPTMILQRRRGRRR
jgi:hypothetical protein